MTERSLPIRWVLISLLAIAVQTFFFPLVSIHIPIAGDQEWSGYDVLAKSRDVDRKLDSFRDIGKSDTASEPSPAPTESSEPTSPSRSAEIEQMLFSMRTLAFLSVEIGLAFLATALAKPRVRFKVLTPYFKSRHRLSIAEMVFCCHTVSRTL
jgi:hypothetical protein